MKKIERFNGEIYRRANLAIAHGALTNSKRPESFVKGIYPTHLKRGQGCYVWDTNNNQYIDFICGLGSNLLGYGNEDIAHAIFSQAKLGSTLSLGTELEVKCAERVKEFFPFVERLRFLKTGSEACSAAIRIARAFTKRSYVFSEGYHGWHDEFTSLTKPASGVFIPAPQIHGIKTISHVMDRDGRNCVAAIIVEPVVTDIRKDQIEHLKNLRELCDEIGALLIFDEVITGLRFPTYSVAQEYNIIPDLICLGKSLAGGLPLSVVAGKAKIMECDYFVSSTFGGETLSLAACLKTLDLLQNKFSLTMLWEKGSQFLFRFNEIWREGLVLEGYPTRSVFVGSDTVKALFMQECCRAGILVGPSFFFNFCHMDLMDEVLAIFSDILNRIKRGEVSLLGEMPQKPFAQKVRG